MTLPKNMKTVSGKVEGYLERGQQLVPVYRQPDTDRLWIAQGTYWMVYDAVLDGPLLHTEDMLEQYPEYMI